MRRRLDKEQIISFGIMALAFALGIVFLVMSIFGIDLTEHITGIVGSYSGLSGGIWLLLLCRNC